MRTTPYKAIASHAEQWAREAGNVQLSYFRNKHLSAETKSSVYDLVTEVDKKCEDLLLQKINTIYPQHDIIGEESGSHKNEGEFCWIIDPLDGTTNYNQGFPIFCVSIGIQHCGETVIGVVYVPYLDEMYSAIKGEGALLNGKPIAVSDKKELSECVLATGFPYDKSTNPDNNLDNVYRIVPNIRGLRRTGSAAFDLCSVAAGTLDGYWELNLHLWDVAAGELIVSEANGLVRPFKENRGISICAGNPTIVQSICNYLDNNEINKQTIFS